MVNWVLVKALLLILAALILPMAVLAIVLLVAAILPAIRVASFAIPRVIRGRSNARRALLPLRAPPALLA